MTAASAQAAALQIPGVWRIRDRCAPRIEATGIPALDRVLPGGGLPVGAITEFLCPRHGLGEFGLLMPLAARLTGHDRRVALVAPPYLPYAPGLAGRGLRLPRVVVIRARDGADARWACEQVLRSGVFAMALAWPARVGERELRRLQVAAETGGTVAVLYRPAGAAAQASPAAVRIAVEHRDERLRLRILKCRGGVPADVGLDPPRLRPAGTAWA